MKTNIKIKNIDTLIIGGGLAGLSTAYHLPRGRSLIVERETELGGTAGSFKVENFTFDYTGHLLHLHHPYTKKLITKFLRGNFYECERKAWIFSHNAYTRYPFQANTHGLPEKVVDECVLGFLDVFLRKEDADNSKLSFEKWCERIFGTGISRHFMFPYNRKLFQVSPQALTVDWCGSFVPKVLLEEVIRGAVEEQSKGFGYNTHFLYPKNGGIQVLANEFGKRIANIYRATSLVKIDVKKKTALLSNNWLVQYKNLVNTIPLNEFLNLTSFLPSNVKSAHQNLRISGILCLNIGVDRPRVSSASWIYFPESKYPFYRVGFPMNFSPSSVPNGCSSMYVEIPLSVANRYSAKHLLVKVKQGLIEARILKPQDRWLVTQWLPIPHAYVIYDKNRTPSLDTIFDFFKALNIQSIGRYGGWKYSFMEEAILDGMRAAETIRAGQS